jgi:hypothetical protein
MGSDVGKILITLIISLLASSILISWFLLNIYGVTAVGIDLPKNIDIGKVYSSNQNFSTDAIDKEIIMINGNWVYVSGIGRVLYYTPMSNPNSYLLIDKLQPDIFGNYDNTYYINNTEPIKVLGSGALYYIALRYTGGIDQNELIFSHEGVSIPTYIINSDFKTLKGKYFFAYPNINLIPYAKIRTVYNDKNLSVSVYFNDEFLFTTNQLNTNQNLFGVFGRQFAGVGATYTGFTLQSYITPNNIINTGQQTGLDLLISIGQLLTVVLKVASFQISPMYIPLEWSILLIATQEAGIVICVAIIIRG